MVRCSSGGVFTAETCESGWTCDEATPNRGAAQCLIPCSEGQEVVTRCNPSITYYQQVYTCSLPMANGGFGAQEDASTFSEYCDHNCDPAQNACMKWSEDEGESCTPTGENAFQPRCENNRRVICEGSGDYQVSVYECLDGTICENGACVEPPPGTCPEGQYWFRDACYAVGDACDSNVSALWNGICDANTVIRCSNRGVITSETCENGWICDEAISGSAATCKMPCSSADESVQVCVTNTNYLRTYQCRAGAMADGSPGVLSNQIASATEYCAHGCDSTNNECIKWSEDEGMPCEISGANIYHDHCENNRMVYCAAVDYIYDDAGNRVTLDDGSYAYVYEVVVDECGTGTTCYEQADENIIGCYPDQYLCSGSEQMQACATSTDNSVDFIATYNCLETTTEGVGVWDMDVDATVANPCPTNTNCIVDENGAAPTCGTIEANLGASCDPNAPGAVYCSNNGVIYCPGTGVWTMFSNCNLYFGYSCVLDDTGIYGGACMSAGESCHEGDGVTYQCDGLYYSNEYHCVEMSGDYYNVYYARHYCSNGCDADTGSCR